MDMPTIRLLYASVARPELRYDDLTAILRSADTHNSAAGITGILCYGGGRFLQALEGERRAVNVAYRRIIVDPRHSGCELIACDEITRRDFPDWTMKLIGWDDVPTAERRALLLQHTGSAVFDPFRFSGAQATQFLAALGRMERAEAA